MCSPCIEENVGEMPKAKNYNPVSTLFMVSKIFDKLVNNSSVDHLKECDLFSDFQYGFRPSLLTTHRDRIKQLGIANYESIFICFKLQAILLQHFSRNHK